MRSICGIYGYGFTRPFETPIFAFVPSTQDPKESRRIASDVDSFQLSGFLECREGYEPQTVPDDEVLLVEDALTFIEQRSVVVTRWLRVPHKTDADILAGLPTNLNLHRPRTSQGFVIADDRLSTDSRPEFICRYVDGWRDDEIDSQYQLRKALGRNVETWRLRKHFVDITYYFAFSGLELLARAKSGDIASSASVVITPLLQGLGFNVTQDDPTVARERRMQTYAHIRNALLHQGQMEKTITENGNSVTLRLTDYEGQLLRLLPLVLIRIIGFDDGHINWDSWIDRVPFK